MVNQDEYYVIPILPGTDHREHTADQPFCYDDGTGCPCREDPDNMQQLNSWHQEGLIGSVDGDLIYHGKTVGGSR